MVVDRARKEYLWNTDFYKLHSIFSGTDELQIDAALRS